MKRWWADTLFKRIFLLMWVALVVSHLFAFHAVRSVTSPPGAGLAGNAALPPVLPSLPPGGPMPDAGPRGPRGDGLDGPPNAGGREMAREMASDGGAGNGPGPGPGPSPRRAMPAWALWLDYAVRFLIIGVAAWFGARWLSAPMRRLASASQALGQALGQVRDDRAAVPRLDEERGTLEVRQTAQVFNTMSQRLVEHFHAQGLLMAAISHDLRTPLARMRLRLESLGPSPEATACAADLREMDGLIGSVLELVRDQHAPAAPQRVDVLALLQALADDHAEQGQAVSVQGEPTVVLAQATALHRVMSNLVGNALRHAGSAEMSVGTRQGHALVTVEDRGPGIPEGQLDAVFKPFYRLESSNASGSTGSGLGLHIARDLLQRMGGQLQLGHRPGGGLRVEVTLPLA